MNIKDKALKYFVELIEQMIQEDRDGFTDIEKADVEELIYQLRKDKFIK